MPTKLLSFLILLGLAGCGSLPRPFQHEGDERPLVSPAPLQPISVAEIAGMPGLAAAVVAAFDQLDIAATRVEGIGHFLRMQGDVVGPNGSLHLRWRITEPAGDVKFTFDQDLPAGHAILETPPDPHLIQATAAAAAQSVATMLRANDLGGTDLAARPKVSVEQVTVKGGLDGDLLKHAIMTSLEQKGLAVVSQAAPYHVTGTVRITHGLSGHDLVEIMWVVTLDKGTELGKVRQGNAVSEDDLLSHANQMTHQIAEGGAEGIVQLITGEEKKRAEGHGPPDH